MALKITEKLKNKLTSKIESLGFTVKIDDFEIELYYRALELPIDNTLDYIEVWKGRCYPLDTKENTQVIDAVLKDLGLNLVRVRKVTDPSNNIIIRETFLPKQ